MEYSYLYVRFHFLVPWGNLYWIMIWNYSFLGRRWKSQGIFYSFLSYFGRWKSASRFLLARIPQWGGSRKSPLPISHSSPLTVMLLPDRETYHFSSKTLNTWHNLEIYLISWPNLSLKQKLVLTYRKLVPKQICYNIKI